MLPFVSQDIVIKKLNQYFTSQNLPLKCDEDGICNGLAHVYAQYVLMGEEEKFHRILKTIAKGKIDESLPSGEFEQFITHVLLSFIPEKYNKELSQASAVRAFGQSETILELGMVLDVNGWQSVIKDIDLKDDEVMVVNSIDHTIAISRKNGRYVVYDPNYILGAHPIESERALVQELRDNVFAYQGQELGLRVQIIKNRPNDAALVNRSALSFYQKYILAKQVNQVAKTDTRSTNNLLLAIECNDEKSILYLLSLGAKIDNLALAKAIIGNHTHVVHQFIQDQSLSDGTINSSIILAIKNGRLETFHVLMANDRFKKQFDTIFLNTNKSDLIKYAANGGNCQLLKVIMEECKKNKTKNHDIKSSMNRKDNCQQILLASIDGGSVDCLKYLIQTFKENQIIIHEEVKMKIFMHALKSNQLYVCSTLLAELPPENIQQLQMSLETVEKTNVYILKELKVHGVIFSEKAEAIIAKKEQRAIGILLWIGIELEKFFDYLTKKQDMTINNKNHFFQPESRKEQENVNEVSQFSHPK